MNKLFGLFLLALAFLAPARVEAGCIIGGGILCTTVAVSYSGPGDVVSGARFWYGLRAYSLATAGTRAMRLCNSGDANCADVNTLANGNFDVATATGSPLNCGGAGGTCTIRTWYDQTTGSNCSAANCDIDNATIAQRATLVLNCLGSLPCAGIASTIARSANSLSSTSIPNSLSAVAKKNTNTGVAQSIFTTAGGSVSQLGYPTTSDTVQVFGGTNLTATAAAATFFALQGVINGGASSAISVNGSYTTGNGGSTAMSGQIAIGEIGGSQSMTGQIAELGAWNTGFSSGQASSMSSNQRGYWGF